MYSAFIIQYLLLNYSRVARSVFLTPKFSRRKYVSSPILSALPHNEPHLRFYCSKGDDESLKESEEESMSFSASSLPAEGSLRLKVRQHVNPLASKYQVPINLSKDWMHQAYGNSSAPIIIDIGCAKGSWALKMAADNAGLHFLGLEIRRPVVDLCLRRKENSKLKNIHFLAVNANVDLDDILSSLRDREQPIEIRAVTVQFPDPHFKSRHKKRRVVNPDLVDSLAKHLKEGTEVFVQSDIEEVEIDMVNHLQNSKYFSPAEAFKLEDLEGNPNPFGVETEREIATHRKNLPVYRMLFKRNRVDYRIESSGVGVTE